MSAPAAWSNMSDTTTPLKLVSSSQMGSVEMTSCTPYAISSDTKLRSMTGSPMSLSVAHVTLLVPRQPQSMAMSRKPNGGGGGGGISGGRYGARGDGGNGGG
eukprot:76710-Chlamydomonas_euryale.AAC.1